MSSFITFTCKEIPTGANSIINEHPDLYAIYAVVANPSAMTVISSSHRLVSGQKASFKTVPFPRDRQPLGGKKG